MKIFDTSEFQAVLVMLSEIVDEFTMLTLAENISMGERYLIHSLAVLKDGGNLNVLSIIFGMKAPTSDRLIPKFIYDIRKHANAFFSLRSKQL